MNTLSVLLGHFDLGFLLGLFVVAVFVLGVDSIRVSVRCLGLLEPPEIAVLLSFETHRLDAANQTEKQQILQQHPHGLMAGSEVDAATNKTRCNFPLYFGSLSYRAVLSNAIRRCLKVSGCSFELIRNRLLSYRENQKSQQRDSIM